MHFYAPFDELEDDDRLRELLWAGSDVLSQNLAIVRELRIDGCATRFSCGPNGEAD